MDQTAISSFISNFYQKLYTSSFNPVAFCTFLNKVKQDNWALWKSDYIRGTALYQKRKNKTPQNKGIGPDGPIALQIL